MISILLATMGRPEMAKATVASISASSAGHDVQIVAAVDGPSRDAFLLGDMGCVVDHSVKPRGCSQAWNAALAMSSGEQVVLAADDLIFEPGWLDAALAKLAEFPGGWGLVGFNDGHWGEELSTHYLMSRRFVIEVLGGVVAWPCYTHSFNDVEANERAKRAGRYAWCEDAHVRHNHWLFGDRAQDGTDARSLPGHAASAQLYEWRAAHNFPNDYEAVISDVEKQTADDSGGVSSQGGRRLQGGS